MAKIGASANSEHRRNIFKDRQGIAQFSNLLDGFLLHDPNVRRELDTNLLGHEADKECAGLQSLHQGKSRFLFLRACVSPCRIAQNIKNAASINAEDRRAESGDRVDVDRSQRH